MRFELRHAFDHPVERVWAVLFDPAYIAAHHFARILILLVLVPMALRLTSRS